MSRRPKAQGVSLYVIFATEPIELADGRGRRQILYMSYNPKPVHNPMSHFSFKVEQMNRTGLLWRRWPIPMKDARQIFKFYLRYDKFLTSRKSDQKPSRAPHIDRVKYHEKAEKLFRGLTDVQTARRALSIVVRAVLAERLQGVSVIHWEPSEFSLSSVKRQIAQFRKFRKSGDVSHLPTTSVFDYHEQQNYSAFSAIAAEGWELPEVPCGARNPECRVPWCEKRMLALKEYLETKKKDRTWNSPSMYLYSPETTRHVLISSLLSLRRLLKGSRSYSDNRLVEILAHLLQDEEVGSFDCIKKRFEKLLLEGKKSEAQALAGISRPSTNS